MPKAPSLASVAIDVDAEREPLEPRPEPDTPFHILFLGDFSGRASRGVKQSLSARKPTLIDRDNFELVMTKLGVEVRIPVSEDGSESLSLNFGELDDFLPDRLYDKLDMFRQLRDLRSQLEDPATFKKTAASLQPSKTARPEPAPRAPEIPDLVSGNLLDNMLEASETRGPSAPARKPDIIRAYIRDIVAPYLVPNPDPKQGEMIRQVDSATSGQMAALLHHPSLQAIEAAWRGLFFMIRSIETSVSLKVFLLDCTKDELAADLSEGDLRSSGFYKLLVERAVSTPGAVPWSLIGANFTFGTSLDDVELLAKTGMIAKKAGAPFLAAASPEVLGCESLVDSPDARKWKENPVWQEFRKFPEASHLGLALPRFLLRLPYGKKTDSTERFDFEEIPGKPRHDDYLWGNPAFACVYLIAQAFSEYGWDMRPGALQNIDGLPLHVYQDDGDSVITPCAEILMLVQTAEAMIDMGLMPLITMKNSDTVRVGMFQNIAGRKLPGRWRG